MPLQVEEIVRGPLETFTHHGLCGQSGEGPYVELWLDVPDGIIRQCGFATHGCPSSVLAAGTLCRLGIGRELARLREITDKELLKIIGGLPPGKEFHATMAVAALSNCSINRDEVNRDEK